MSSESSKTEDKRDFIIKAAKAGAMQCEASISLYLHLLPEPKKAKIAERALMTVRSLRDTLDELLEA